MRLRKYISLTSRCLISISIIETIAGHIHTTDTAFEFLTELELVLKHLLAICRNLNVQTYFQNTISRLTNVKYFG